MTFRFPMQTPFLIRSGQPRAVEVVGVNFRSVLTSISRGSSKYINKPGKLVDVGCESRLGRPRVTRYIDKINKNKNQVIGMYCPAPNSMYFVAVTNKVK